MAHKLNLHKILFWSILGLKFCSKYICLLGFFYLKLFICPSDVKRPKFSRNFTLWTPFKASLWIHCRACSILRPSPVFYNIQKLNLSTKKTVELLAQIPGLPYLLQSNFWMIIWMLIYGVALLKLVSAIFLKLIIHLI